MVRQHEPPLEWQGRSWSYAACQSEDCSRIIGTGGKNERSTPPKQLGKLPRLDYRLRPSRLGSLSLGEGGGRGRLALLSPSSVRSCSARSVTSPSRKPTPTRPRSSSAPSPWERAGGEAAWPSSATRPTSARRRRIEASKTTNYANFTNLKGRKPDATTGRGAAPARGSDLKGRRPDATTGRGAAPARGSDNNKNSEGVTEHPRFCHSFRVFHPHPPQRKPRLSRDGESPRGSFSNFTLSVLVF